MTLGLQQVVARLMLNGRMRLIFAALIILSIFGIIVTYRKQPDIRFCFIDVNEPTGLKANGGPQRLEDVLLADFKPPRGHSIFFHETSCHQLKQQNILNYEMNVPPRFNLVQLTARQACAIESAALHNPNLSVFVLFSSPTYRENTSSNPMIDAIMAYPNVHLRNLNLWTYAAGTPIYEWLKDGQLFSSRYVISHMSDFLRYLTLYRYGGTYLDLDIVMLRSMEDVPPNFSGAESDTHVAAGVMNFSPDGFGHVVAEKCLRDFQKNFDGNRWGNNGPGVITRVAQTICKTKDVLLMIKQPKRCMGFKIYPRDAFYAVVWKRWEDFFEPDRIQEILKLTKHSFVTHLWNKHSNGRQITVGSNVAYGKIAEQHCPRAYAAAGKYF